MRWAEENPALLPVCDYYLNIADQIVSRPEGVVPEDTPDRELFALLSDLLYLNPAEPPAARTEEEELDLMMV